MYSKHKNALSIFLFIFSIAITSLISLPAFACTRVVYLGSDGVVITGRTLDWMQDMKSNLWVFPRGMKRDGAAGPKSITWVSKYGSVIVSGYDVGTADGMNENGLVANALYLVESNYGKPAGKKPLLSIGGWAQYVLDNFANVNEAVAALAKEPFDVIAPVLPNGSPAQLHLSISDSTGDSAIFEYINGKLMIHHGKQYQVMTNSPDYDSQLALDSYWKAIGGLTFLPGTNRASDRFARAAFFVGAIPTISDPNYINAVPSATYSNQAVASVTSLMRSVSVPLGITTPGAPNIASTIWRTVADQKNKIYYFDSATSPNTFWVVLSELDFKAGAPVKELIVTGGKVYSGDMSSKFEPAEPFKFLSAQAN
ncbi:MAG: linear amide C-N hydrolase [Gammaproteobacteria bacterium]|nr:linear amide C-N hydrolase [Gammaproteobacteria bacterium]